MKEIKYYLRFYSYTEIGDTLKKIKWFLIFLVLLPNTCKAITISSSSLAAMDIESGRVFYAQKASEKRLIASTTKLMTAILAIESNQLTDIVEAKEEVLTIYGSNIYLEYGEHMVLLDLIYGLMMRSGNDAAVVLARHIGGSVENFVARMNQKAQEIGMTDTVFHNPHGLDEETKNYSTAYDLCLLYRYAWQNETFRKIAGTKNYRTSTEKKSYAWQNRTKILFQYDKSTGGKTGYTPSAKKVLVSSASNQDLDVVIASFNYDYDYTLQEKLFEEIFENYEKKEILDKKKFHLNSPYDGTIYIKNSFSYPLTKKEEDGITTKVEWLRDKKPKQDEKIGVIYVYLKDEIIHKEDLYIRLNSTSFKEKIITFFKKIFQSS